MSIENKKTLEVYDEMAGKYLANTIEDNASDPEKAKRKSEALS